MSANPNTHAIDNPVDQNRGVIWNRLHSEREDICEALLKEPYAAFENEAQRPANGHKELLQARLRKIDDALDRLMAGSYGNCSKCGLWIEDTKLDFDAAIEFCLSCWDLQQRDARTLSPFETTWARTPNIEYHPFLLDHTGPSWMEDLSLLSH